MNLICPECKGTLEITDSRTARCMTHGGQYEVLFARQMPQSPPPVQADPSADAVTSSFSNSFMLAPDAMCARHPEASAIYACAGCGKPICAACDYEQDSGEHLCMMCAKKRASQRVPVVRASKPLGFGMFCVQHPRVDATAKCKNCGAHMCDTCKFEFPGRIFICPVCATAPRVAVGTKQKKLLIASYVLASWSTLAMGATLGGMLAGLAQSEVGDMLLGFIVLFVVLAPAIAGFSTAIAAKRPRHPAPVSLWVAAVWNGLIVIGLVLLMVVGMLSKG